MPFAERPGSPSLRSSKHLPSIGRVLGVLAWGAALTALPFLSACDEDEPRLVVVMRSDLAARDELVSVTVELVGLTTSTTTSIARGDDLANGVVVYDRHLSPLAERHLRLHLVGNDGELATRDLVFAHLADREISVLVPRLCVDVDCDEDGGETCVLGQCAAATCVDGDESVCPDAMCESDDECAPSAACATGVCSEGVCLGFGDDDQCATGEWCSPDEGCSVMPYTVDAGVTDGGT